jgi:hypothetical protein
MNVQATSARHKFAINTKSGGELLSCLTLESLTRILTPCIAIIGIDLKGPQAAAQHLWSWEPQPDQLPRLRALSDLYWGYWLWHNSMDGTSVSNINAYVVYSVRNTVTKQVIDRALETRGVERLTSWPGTYFAIESAEGNALLGVH